MVAWAGHTQVALPYDRHARAAGESKYPLGKMLRFATDGILSFSSKPLKAATNLGLLAAFLACLGIAYALVMRLTTSAWVEGWTALMIDRDGRSPGQERSGTRSAGLRLAVSREPALHA